MKANDLNQIAIVQYLAKQNIHPVKEKGNSAFYHSPFRVDNDPSLKVDTEANVWYDFGLGKGGQLIDLVMLLDKCTLYQAIVKLEKTDICSNVSTLIRMNTQIDSQTNSFSFQGETERGRLPSIRIQRVTELIHPALLQYLAKRTIPIDIARAHCKQIHYGIDNKNYFAIGFKNNSQGWNLRNEYFKGCTSMDISTSNAVDNSTCLVFEGFMDYLSFLMLNKQKKAPCDVLVLNSTANLSKAINFLQQHQEVHTYLDNDEGGRKATLQIQQTCKSHINKASEYSNFKDLNEFLVAQQQGKKQRNTQGVKQKPSKGFRL